MSTLITVDLRDATPPFEQIREQIASLIAIGQLADGSRLPTVRALAGDLGVAVGTVARAYKELEAAGLIESRRRLGTIVTYGSRTSIGTDHSFLETKLDELINHARNSGVADETLLALLRGRLRTEGMQEPETTPSMPTISLAPMPPPKRPGSTPAIPDIAPPPTRGNS